MAGLRIAVEWFIFVFVLLYFCFFFVFFVFLYSQSGIHENHSETDNTRFDKLPQSLPSLWIWICILRPVIHNSCLAAVAGPLQCCSRMSLGWKYSKCYPCVCTNCSKQTHPSNIPGDVCRGDACISVGPEPEDQKPETSEVPPTSHGCWLAGIVEPSKTIKKTSSTIKSHQEPSRAIRTHQPWMLIGWSCGASQPFFWKLHFLPEVYTDPTRSVRRIAGIL